jgi:tetratricopeptide (TPR) repeat protein
MGILHFKGFTFQFLASIWVIFFFLCTIFSLKSQSNGEAAFAFVQNKTNTKNARTKAMLTDDNPKYLTALSVYNTLIHARGDLRLPAPAFVMSKNENYVAWMDATKVLIGLEEKSFDVCMGFGADSLNALAALLAHEITHYYEKHDWTQHFITEQNGSDLGKKLLGIKEGIKHEAQADYLGGFLAISSGFPISDLMPRLLDSLYSSYHLPDTLLGYPSLKERKAMSEATQSKLKELQYAFEISNFLAILGCYEAAATYQHFLLNEFQSREIYNNAGVLSVISALESQDNDLSSYYFPLEIDPVSRLSSNKKGNQLQNNSLLQKATDYFLKAKELDPNYATANLNLACVYALQEQMDEAHYFIKKAEKLSKKQNDQATKSNILVVRGIISCIEKDTLAALKFFEKARNQGNELAILNEEKLLNSAKKPTFPAKNTSNKNIEKIDSVSLDRFLIELNVAQVLDIEKGKTTLGIKKLNNSMIFVHLSEEEQQTVVIQTTHEKSAEKTQLGVGFGTKQKEILATYQEPSKKIQTNNGQYWVYFSAQIGFQFDENNEVINWFTFRMKNN